MKPFIRIKRTPAIKFIQLAFILLVFIQMHNCQKQPRIVLLKTGVIDTVGFKSAEINGEIVDPGEGIAQYGHCWALAPQDPKADLETRTTFEGANEPKPYTSVLTNLLPGNNYNVRAYAIVDGDSPDYGDSTPLSTLDQSKPELRTSEVTHYTQTTATVGGEIISSGGAEVTERGVYWGSLENPRNTGKKQVINSESDVFEYELTELSPGTLYYVESYAVNEVEPGYGGVEIFETPGTKIEELPIAAFTVNRTQIAVNESIIFTDESENGPTEWLWEFGDEKTSVEQYPNHAYEAAGSYTVRLTVSNEFGSNSITKTDYISAGNPPYADFYVSKRSPGVGEFVQFFDQSINSPTSWLWDFGDGGTSPDQNPEHSYTTAGTYTVTLRVTNAFGTNTNSKSSYISVEQVEAAPVADFTANKTRVAENYTANFTDNSDNDPTSWLWTFGDGGTSPDQNPEHRYTTAGKYTVTLKASNNAGSDEVSKTDFITVVVVDVDDNEYEAVQIGDQIWMAENLKVTRYADESGIQNIQSTSEWASLSYSDKAYCWYSNNMINGNTYGAMYTWAAAMNGATSSNSVPSNVRGICPAGWHLPSDEEWKVLMIALGMPVSVAEQTGFRGTDEGGKLKEAGYDHWLEPNVGASNESKFTALPGGTRSNDGNFFVLGEQTVLWTSTEEGETHAWNHKLSYNSSQESRGYFFKDAGFSVRCIKD